jgi:enediyne biosynthesis protein E4
MIKLTQRQSAVGSGTGIQSRFARSALCLLCLGGVLSVGCRPSVDDPARDTRSTGAAQEAGAGVSNAKSDSKDGTFRFLDRTPQSGIEFTYRNGEEAGHFAILESLGGGVGILDFDRDGLEDVFVPGGGDFNEEPQPVGLPGGLFRNLGDWRFSDVAASAGVDRVGYYSHGAAVADFDNDGFPDILVTGYGGLQLWHNHGDGTFSEIAVPAGLTDRLWSSSAGWGDLDGDGTLDLYVVHYVDWSFENHPYCPGPEPGLREVCPPREYEPLPDTLYLSNGDGTFRNATQEWGLSVEGKGLGVILADLDLDGDLDIYVANDTVENFLYENVGGRLNDVSLLSGSSLSERGVPDGSMGVDLFDYNRDGLPDIWVVNYERESAALYENLGRLMFRHTSQPVGITAVGGLYVGWGTCCFDINRNGHEDIFISNGHVIRYPKNAPLLQRPLLLENLQGVRFRNVAPMAGEYMTSSHMGRGAAISDLNNSGAVDLIVSHTNEPVRVLSNETPPEGGWLAVDLIGTISPRDAVGAIVTLIARGGERQVRQWRGGGSYASTNSRRLYFGLGEAREIEKIEIRWPSGVRQDIDAPAPNQLLQVIEKRSARLGGR